MLLEGDYWTGRNTSGNMTFSGRKQSKKKFRKKNTGKGNDI